VRSWYTANKGVDLADGRQASTPLARLRAINRPVVEWLAARGIDLAAGDMVEVAPAIQHFQGGVKIRTHAETTVAGLYAAGEVAGGQHGANRPGGNALLDCQVFGRIAGESAAKVAAADRPSGPGAIADREAQAAVRALLAEQGADAAAVREQVRRAMSRGCGVVRTERALRDLGLALEEMDRRGVAVGASPLADAVEAMNILQSARLVVRAALERDESRGPHLRFGADGSLVPLPRDDAAWSRYIVLRAGAAGPVSERREPVRPG
jgi:succinate dehydrogenase / fumarate reductase flavoprotein subunit